MKLAENYSSLYAIVGFPSITEPAHTLCSLLDFNLDILTVNNAAEVRHTLERLQQGGYRMVVCDMVTHTIAREMGFDAFLHHLRRRKPPRRHRPGREHQLLVRPSAAGEPVPPQHHPGPEWPGHRHGVQWRPLLQQHLRGPGGAEQRPSVPHPGDTGQRQPPLLLHRAGPALQHHRPAAADEQRPAVSVLLCSGPHPRSIPAVPACAP